MSQVTIVSLAPYSPFGVFRAEGPSYVMEAKKRGEPYAKLVVHDGRAFKDFGEGQRSWETIPAREIAEDLIRDCKQHGVFIAAGDEPTDEELREASRQLRQVQYPKWIEEGDDVFNRTGERKDVSLHAKIAARELNLKREWALDLSEMVSCPGCNELVPEGVAKCGKCQAVLNWDKARSLGLVTPEQYTFAVERGLAAPLEGVHPPAPAIKRGPGRPPKIRPQVEANG